MKDHILKILQMQQEGKLTQDQAAELLAVLAGQGKWTRTTHPHSYAPQGEILLWSAWGAFQGCNWQGGRGGVQRFRRFP